MPIAAATRRDHDGRAMVAWGGVVALGVIGGGWVTSRHPRFHTDASPFHGHWLLLVRAAALAPAAAGVVLVLIGPWGAERLRWRSLLVAAPTAAFVWAAALSITVGGHGFAEPMHEAGGYLDGVPLVRGDFLRSFTTAWPGYPTHVKGHPPGLVLLLAGLDRVGLGGATWAALVVVGVGATAVAAVLITVAEVSDQATARRVAPFLVLAPAAVWMATSGDALFTGVAAWAVAATVHATSTRRRGAVVVAGALWAGALLLSYGLVLLAPVAIGVAWWRRRLDVLVGTALTAVGVLAGFGLVTGFWWPAGLAATRVAYHAGYASNRPGWVFVWLNVCALAVAIGPAAAPAVTRLRTGGASLLVGGALVGLALADLSLLSKAEVERIWLPWVPWVLVATATLPAVRRRWWLAAQSATGLAVQLALRSTW